MSIRQGMRRNFLFYIIGIIFGKCMTIKMLIFNSLSVNLSGCGNNAELYQYTYSWFLHNEYFQHHVC